MKKIINIAKLELRLLFYSPIAWIVLIVFIIQTGITFTDLLYSQETQQQLGRSLNVLSKVLFAGEKGILATVQQNLYLYIPLLTMGLMSRETSSGSIKLLYSSPVTIKEIVFGKFLSMMVYGLILVAALACFLVAGYFSIENLDVPFVLGGLLGIYLLICAYAAIGLFMSSLTDYQVVAAISTLAVLAALNFVSSIGQRYDLVREITYWLSISGRADGFVNGLITSSAILYFLLVIALFISLSIMKLSNEKKTRKTSLKIIGYSALIIGFVAVGFVSSLPGINVYFDTTRFKDRTLTKGSQKIVGQLKAPISITSFVNVVDYTAGYGAPKNRIKDKKHFEKYLRFIPKMKMNYVFYYDKPAYHLDTTKTLKERAQEASEALGFDFDELLTPTQIAKVKDLQSEDNRFVRFVHYQDKETPLRMFNDIFVYPGEAEITAALKRMLQGPEVVGIVTGHNERSTTTRAKTSYKTITKGLGVRGSLINQGFKLVDVNLNKVKAIPKSVQILILADPKSPYSSEQEELIKKYIESGRNLLIAGEPGRQSYLNPILSKLGVSFSPGTLLFKSEDFKLDLIQSGFTKAAEKIGFKYYADAVVTFPGAVQIKYDSTTAFKKTPILLTDQGLTWNKQGKFNLNTEQISFKPKEDKKVVAPVALAVTRKLGAKTQKIMVVGDADFMSNAELSRYNINTVNASFALRMFKWFSDGEYPVSVGRPAAIDKVIKISRSQINLLKVIFMGALPLLLGGAGGLLLYLRKRK